MRKNNVITRVSTIQQSVPVTQRSSEECLSQEVFASSDTIKEKLLKPKPTLEIADISELLKEVNKVKNKLRDVRQGVYMSVDDRKMYADILIQLIVPLRKEDISGVYECLSAHRKELRRVSEVFGCSTLKKYL